MMVHLHRSAVTAVNAHERHIEVVAREHEVVRVAAEECDLVFGRKHEADVLQAAVLVQVIAATAVQADDLAAEFIRRGALLFDAGDGGPLSLGKLVGGDALRCRLHPLGDVSDFGELVELHPGAARLVRLLLGEEAVSVEIFFREAREVLDALASAVVVRHHEAVRRHDRGRAAAGNPHRRESQMIEPVLRRLEAVLRLHLGRRKVVERPHAFVGEGGGGEQHGSDRQQELFLHAGILGIRGERGRDAIAPHKGRYSVGLVQAVFDR